MHRRLDIGVFLSPKWTLSISQESSTTRLVKVFLQNHKMSPSKKTTPVHYKREPALCLRQIERARKWQPRVREKLERGKCDSALSVTVLMQPSYVVQEIVHNWLSLRGRLFTIVVFLVKKLISVAEWWQYENKTIQQRNNFNFDQASICQRTTGPRNSLLLNRQKNIIHNWLSIQRTPTPTQRQYSSFALTHHNETIDVDLNHGRMKWRSRKNLMRNKGCL